MQGKHTTDIRLNVYIRKLTDQSTKQ